MRRIQNKQFRRIGLLACLGMLFFASCEENISDAVPADGNIAYVNFVNAEEAALFGGDFLYSENYVYFGDSVSQSPFDHYSSSNYPATFSFDNNPVSVRSYPNDQSSSPIESASHTYTGSIVTVNFLPVPADEYHFIFTSKNRTYLKALDTRLERGTWHFIYLAESPANDSAYVVLDVPILRSERKEGTVKLQLLNLSTDLGAMEVFRVDSAGNETPLALPEPLAFGAHADLEFSLEGTEQTNNNVSLRIRRAGETADLLSIAFPAENGAVYTAIVRGFVEGAVRKVKEDNEQYATVDILPNLRYSLRRVFY